MQRLYFGILHSLSRRCDDAHVREKHLRDSTASPMRVWAREWRGKPDKVTEQLLDALGVEGASRLEHGELGDLYVADLDQFLTRGMVFVFSGVGSMSPTYTHSTRGKHCRIPDNSSMTWIKLTPPAFRGDGRDGPPTDPILFEQGLRMAHGCCR